MCHLGFRYIYLSNKVQHSWRIQSMSIKHPISSLTSPWLLFHILRSYQAIFPDILWSAEIREACCSKSSNDITSRSREKELTMWHWIKTNSVITTRENKQKSRDLRKIARINLLTVKYLGYWHNNWDGRLLFGCPIKGNKLL